MFRLIGHRASWVQTKKFLLPIPSTIMMLNALVALATLLVYWFANRIRAAASGIRATAILPVLANMTLLIPMVPGVQSASYLVTRDIRACLAESKWSHLFRTKNEAAIRSIQDTLHCCGFNSMHDRAWPFPSKSIDAHTCERTTGFAVSCGSSWQHEFLIAAGLNLAASVVLEVLLVRISLPITSSS